MKNFTPREIVSELDRYIVGQKNAKRAVAIALRNRWRRQQVDPELRDEIAPKNIIMMGPTGIGKTEIARRLAKLAEAPFLKIEASKFTEVGYVGKDVESMIRDLTELAVKMIKEEEKKKVDHRAKEMAEEKIIDLLLPRYAPERPLGSEAISPEALREQRVAARAQIRQLLHEGKLNEEVIELKTREQIMPVVEIFSAAGMEEMNTNLRDMFGNMFPKKQKTRRLKVPEALKNLAAEETQRLIDMDKVIELALKKVQESGIIFLDEIDKIAGRESGHGPEVSREGVQRDLLPIVEGSSVTTKYGMVKTDHILFIAAGAFHVSKPSDLIPELQGRFPIRVELDSLTRDNFIQILKEPRNSLTKQYKALLATEKIDLEITEDAIDEIAEIATLVNERTENIGARRLHTVMEKILEDISFDAPDKKGSTIRIDQGYVRQALTDIIKNEDLSRYIL